MDVATSGQLTARRLQLPIRQGVRDEHELRLSARTNGVQAGLLTRRGSARTRGDRRPPLQCGRRVSSSCAGSTAQSASGNYFVRSSPQPQASGLFGRSAVAKPVGVDGAMVLYRVGMPLVNGRCYHRPLEPGETNGTSLCIDGAAAPGQPSQSQPLAASSRVKLLTPGTGTLCPHFTIAAARARSQRPSVRLVVSK